jgi:DNA-binding NtrC family response regulator
MLKKTISGVVHFEQKVSTNTPSSTTGGDHQRISGIIGDLRMKHYCQANIPVTAAIDGAGALAQIEKYNGTIHLLLTDEVLPNMNSKEVYEMVVKKHPSLRVLFMSGYSNNVIAHRGVLDEGINFSQKPFSVHGLGIKVRNILDEGSPHT